MLKRIVVLFLLVCFIVLLNVPSAFASEEVTETMLPFILKNENFAFHERTDALIIDAGKEVDDSTLDISDFDVHVTTTRKVDPDYVGYDGPREVIDVYTSEVNDSGSPSDSGRYIVVDFPDVGWEDGGSTIADGYTFDLEYTITYKGDEITFVDGSSLVPEGFTQDDIVSPVLDKYQYANYEGLDYSYFYNEDVDEPLPLVVFFHGGGQGNDIYTPIRFSNGGTVWANPENQEKYPSHVLAPRNATTPEDMHKVKGVIDDMIAEGKVDPNRVYITGFSMGGGSTWTFMKTYPDFAAAAAPLCPAGGPDNVEDAEAVAYLPVWSFVDEGDFLYDAVVEIDETYGPYMNDSLLTILPENRLDEPPYNGHVFDGHAVWLPVYNEYEHPERGMLIDWLFSKSKIRDISDVEVNTVSGVAPTLPETVTVDVNYSATGIASEERAVDWEEVDPDYYGNDGPGVFEVEGTVEGAVEKVTATVTVEYRNRIADLKETVADLDIVRGNKNALMVKLNKAEDFLSDTKHDKSAQAIKQLDNFIKQVNNFVKPGKLTEEQAEELIEATEESIRHINE
ncbi:FIMAH domain-containing protein [Gracilibacillus kekensis]|uniref:Predicted peptidase n=1 Tax=Gracilibacillus kekensis TaxID=1027249 RepID=A0A1M7Q0L6_9BACI|nr:Ig-like domain-containing protein [Gracilibacillus kekensis]SHN23623.1 Predicted peptidase [Gracilibacillus kekensis]